MEDSVVKERYLTFLLGNLSLVFALAGISALFLIDYRYVYPVVFSLYFLLMGLEFHHKIYSATTIVLTLVYGTLFCTNLLGWEELGYYAGQIIYSLLALVNIVSLAIRKPITMVYDKTGKGVYHFLLSWVWTGVYGISLAMSVALMPSVYFVLVPLGLVSVGCGINIYINLFSGRHFLTVKTKPLEVKDKTIHFAICNKGNKSHVKLIGDFINLEFNNNYDFGEYISDSEDFNIIYGYYKDGDTIKIASSLIVNVSRKLIISPTLTVDLEKVNKLVKVAHMDDLVLDGPFRTNPDIIFSMFLYSLELCMLKSVDMMITFCLKSRIELFKKIGFFKVSELVLPKKGFSRILGTRGPHPEYQSYEGLVPMVFNLSESIVKADLEKDKNAAAYSEKFNPMILEYYFKTAFMRSLGKSWPKKPFNLLNHEIKEIFSVHGALA